jgi:hypothetical protein
MGRLWRPDDAPDAGEDTRPCGVQDRAVSARGIARRLLVSVRGIDGRHRHAKSAHVTLGKAKHQVKRFFARPGCCQMPARGLETFGPHRRQMERREDGKLHYGSFSPSRRSIAWRKAVIGWAPLMAIPCIVPSGLVLPRPSTASTAGVATGRRSADVRVPSGRTSVSCTGGVELAPLGSDCRHSGGRISMRGLGGRSVGVYLYEARRLEWRCRLTWSRSSATGVATDDGTAFHTPAAARPARLVT